MTPHPDSVRLLLASAVVGSYIVLRFGWGHSLAIPSVLPGIIIGIVVIATHDYLAGRFDLYE